MANPTEPIENPVAQPGEKRKSSVNSTGDKSNKKGKKKVSPTTEGSNTSAPPPHGSNAAFWKMKYKYEDGTESDTTPYKLLWDFLARDEGKYLCALRKRPYKGKSVPINVSLIAREAFNYLSSQGVPVDKVEAVRSQLYRIDQNCRAARKMVDAFGNDDCPPFIDALLKKCPVWDEAQKYYVTVESNAASTPDNNIVTKPEVEDERNSDGSEEVPTAVPRNSHNNNRMYDLLLQSIENIDKVEDNTTENLFAEALRCFRNKMCGDLVVSFFNVLRHEADMSLKEKITLAEELAEDVMNKKSD